MITQRLSRTIMCSDDSSIDAVKDDKEQANATDAKVQSKAKSVDGSNTPQQTETSKPSTSAVTFLEKLDPSSTSNDFLVPNVAAFPQALINKIDPSRKKTAPKYEKAPEAPKRFKSAFILFSAEKHKQIRAQLGDRAQKERTASISKVVAEGWKELPAEEKEKWETLARADRDRYELEKSLYKGPWHVLKKRKQKDASAPKRPMSAFLAFANARRAEVKRQMQTASNGDVSRALAAMWKEASEEVRQRYIGEEAEKRQGYLAAVSDWKKAKEEEKCDEQQQRNQMALHLSEALEVTNGSGGVIDPTRTVFSTFDDEDYQSRTHAATVPRSSYSMTGIAPNYSSYENDNSNQHEHSLTSFLYPFCLPSTASGLSRGYPSPPGQRNPSHHDVGTNHYPYDHSFHGLGPQPHAAYPPSAYPSGSDHDPFARSDFPDFQHRGRYTPYPVDWSHVSDNLEPAQDASNDTTYPTTLSRKKRKHPFT